MSGPPTHRQRLIEHFASFASTDRARFRELYGAPNARPEDLAEHFITEAEAVRTTIRAQLPEDGDAFRLMETLAHDHDLYVDVGWSSRTSRRRLHDLGLVARAASREHAHELEMVGAMAAVVAPLLRGISSTIPTLLAARDDEYINSVAAAWDITAPTSVEKVLRVSQHLAAPERATDMIDLLGAGEYVAVALMALELGGYCYWQEVFGHDLASNPEFGENVVALMRSDEREYEQHIADTLVDYGVLFRFDEAGRAPLAIVPEELWAVLWTIGRQWMMEWTSYALSDLAETSVRRSLSAEAEDFQPALKWLLCEADAGRLELAAESDDLSEATIERLVSVGGQEREYWLTRASLAMELGAFRLTDDGVLIANEAIDSLVDLPRSAFLRQVLLDWNTGYVGANSDQLLTEALGMDEAWRRSAIDTLQRRQEFVPLWMRNEGVESRLTGSGFLRDDDDVDDEILMMEYGLANGVVWSMKLVWLDLLSLLEPRMWFARSALIELLQLSAGFSAFSQLTHVLEEPHMSYYLPLQRASLMADHLSTHVFEQWFDDVMRSLMIPLGLAVLSDEDDAVWLRTTEFRTEGPPGLPMDLRVAIIREIVGNDELAFSVPGLTPPTLQRVDRAPPDDSVALDRSLATVREWLQNRNVVRFDGKRIWVE